MSGRFDLGRGFYWLWSGESLAVVGTALMEFALGVWIYNHTGSTVAFANAVLAATLPAVLFLPLAGGLADRFSHRAIILCCDLILATLLLGLMTLLWADRLQPLHLYAFNALASVVSAFRKPAYQAAVSLLVKPGKFTKASGLSSLSKNTSALVAPLLAGVIMAQSGLVTILMVDLIAYCAGSLLVVKAFSGMRRVVVDKNRPETTTDSAQGHVRLALGFLASRRTLLGLLVYTMARGAVVAVATLMMTPLLLSTLGSQALGMAYTWAALGGLAAAGVLIMLGEPRNLLVSATLADAVLAVCVMGLGWVAQAWAYYPLVFIAICMAGIADACVNALWMRNLGAASRASVFALISMLTITTTSVLTLLGGFAVDHWLQPAMQPGGAYAAALGPWLGTGTGRGVGLLLVSLGALLGLFVLLLLASGAMRRLGRTVPVSHDRQPEAGQSPLASSNAEHAH